MTVISIIMTVISVTFVNVFVEDCFSYFKMNQKFC